MGDHPCCGDTWRHALIVTTFAHGYSGVCLYLQVLRLYLKFHHSIPRKCLPATKIKQNKTKWITTFKLWIDVSCLNCTERIKLWIFDATSWSLSFTNHIVQRHQKYIANYFITAWGMWAYQRTQKCQIINLCT